MVGHLLPGTLGADMARSGSVQGGSWRDASAARPGARFWIETLGCPKNAVDSDKVAASLLGDGLTPARSAADADLVVVNTCAFVEAARQESIDTVLALADTKRESARPGVTGGLAGR